MEEQTNKYLITFNKPYQFEGADYTEVNLDGLENLTARDLGNADKIFATTGQMPVMSEMSVTYACIIASKATGKPIEFFENLPAKEAVKLKNMVTGFFYKED